MTDIDVEYFRAYLSGPPNDRPSIVRPLMVEVEDDIDLIYLKRYLGK